MTLQEEGGDVSADVAGGTGQKDGHGLVLGPRADAAPCAAIFRAFRLIAGMLQRKSAVRTHFHRAPFDERVDPPAQGWNMDVNPIIPPVNGGRIVTKRLALFRRKRCGKQLHILSFKDLLVMQDKRLVELDQLFDSSKVAFWRASGGFFICRAEAARLIPLTTAFCAGTENFS